MPFQKKGIVNENLILHLDASNSSSLNQNDLSNWNDLTSNNNDLSIKNWNYAVFF